MVVKVKESFEKTRQVKNHNKSKKYLLFVLPALWILYLTVRISWIFKLLDINTNLTSHREVNTRIEKFFDALDQ